MNMTTLDIICIVLVIGVGMIGYIKGAINTLIGLAGFIASFVIARIFSAPVTNWLLNVEPVKNFINDAITQNVINAVGQYGSEALTNLQGIAGLDFLSGITDTSALSGTSAGHLSACKRICISDSAAVVQRGLWHYPPYWKGNEPRACYRHRQ